MRDPLAELRSECAALIKSRVREPAGYRFDVPPHREMGQLGCNVAFQLPRLRKNSPLKIAQEIVAGMDRGGFRLVGDVRAAEPGFINFYANRPAYATLVLEAIQADGDRYGWDEQMEQDAVTLPDLDNDAAGEVRAALEGAGAQVDDMLRGAARDGKDASRNTRDGALLDRPAERDLIDLLGRFPEAMHDAGASGSPEMLSGYVSVLAGTIGRFYRAGLVQGDDLPRQQARLHLVAMTAQVLRNLRRYLHLEAVA